MWAAKCLLSTWDFNVAARSLPVAPPVHALARVVDAVFRALFRRHIYLALLGPLIAGTIGAIVLVTMIDPYHVYGWGAVPHLARAQYEPGAQPRLLNVISSQGYDTLIVGGSTAQQFSPTDAEAVLGGTKRAFVLTYSGPRPRDLKVVMSKVATAPKLQRVLLSFDNSYLFPANIGRGSFPFTLYDGDLLNNARSIDFEAVMLSLRLFTGREFFLPAWDFERTQLAWRREFERSQSPAFVRHAREMIEQRRNMVLDPARLSCADIPGIPLVVDFARDLARRNVRLDIVIPPYSYLIYYHWFDDDRRQIVKNEPPLAAMLTMRRCLLEAVEPLGSASIYAFDLRQDIVGDLGNYRDSAHLYGSDVGRKIFKLIESGQGRLTLTGFDAYAAELKRNVADYHYTNSRLAR
jgi:hypothetical protein